MPFWVTRRRLKKKELIKIIELIGLSSGFLVKAINLIIFIKKYIEPINNIYIN
jgi:hypothetical protein